MKNSIEEIWKEGFLNENSLVAPKINDLYNQRSRGLIGKMKRMYRINLIALVCMALVFPVLYYFLEMTWQGIATSVLLLFTAWYSKRQKRDIHTLDHGLTSLDYLKAFERWLKDGLLKSEKVLRFTYPLYFLIAMSAIATTWAKIATPMSELRRNFPGLVFIGDYPLIAIILVALLTLLISFFSDRIFRWDVRLVYGRVFRKLEEIIAEMENLKQGV